jgi:D-hydroxyproline dehydrogenase subunit gamma
MFGMRETASSRVVFRFHSQSCINMSKSFFINVNGRSLQVSEDTSVAAAMIMAGQPCRRSVSGEPRSPLCGMGICLECRATVNGEPHRRTCQLLCVPNMEVVTE